MPRKKPEKSTALVAVSRHDLPRSDRKRNTGERVLGTTRAAFLKAYEVYGGNVTKACQVAGIHRRTFYRWRDSATRLNAKFRKRLAAIRPDDMIVDAAELTIAEAISDGNVDAAKFTLRTKGKNRGWSEAPDPEVVDLFEKLVIVFNRFAASRPGATVEDKARWVSMIAEKARVEPQELAKRIGL